MSSVPGFVARVAAALAVAAGAAAPPVVHLATTAGRVERPGAAVDSERPAAGAAGAKLAGPERREPGAEGAEGERLRGLDNAIARVSANLERHPNRGLANALERLEGNRARHEARRAARAGDLVAEDGRGRGEEGRVSRARSYDPTSSGQPPSSGNRGRNARR